MIGPVIDDVNTIRPRPDCDQRIQAGLHAVDGALHVDVKHNGELVGGHRLQRRIGVDARVGAQHVQSAEGLNDRSGHCGAGVAVGHVDCDADGLARAKTVEGGDGGIEVGLRARPDRDVRARRGEHRRDAAADSLAAAGDQHRLTGQ